MLSACQGRMLACAAGANMAGSIYQPHITSYDYDCPISEAGGYRAARHRRAQQIRGTAAPSTLLCGRPAAPCSVHHPRLHGHMPIMLHMTALPPIVLQVCQVADALSHLRS